MKKKRAGLFFSCIGIFFGHIQTPNAFVLQSEIQTVSMTNESNIEKSVPSPALLKQKSIEARQMLQSIQVGPYCIKRYKNERTINGREIALAVYSPENNTIEIALLGLCYKQPQNLIILTSDFKIQWLEGHGITRFSFAITDLQHHSRILLDKKEWMNETNKGEYYFPYTDDFLQWEFVEDGAQFLFSSIREAKKELCLLNAQSRSIPNKKLCEIFPDDLLLNVNIIEQIDDDEFSNICPQINSLPQENRIFQNCAEYSVFKVLIHYARNKEQAFSFTKSKAGAIGPAQFTKKTYNDIAIKQYPDAKLISNFEIGARNLQNAIKAQICLLDLELSRMSEKMRQIFQLDYRIGGLYPVVAYNGGGNRARCLFQQERANKRCRATKRAWKETTGYITKYKGIWHIIDSLKNRIISSNQNIKK